MALRRVALDTLGCKLNQAETEAMARSLAQWGYQVVGRGADIYILNTCTVTQVADGKARQGLRTAHLHHPGAFIVATGCYVQRAPQDVSAISGVGLLWGNEEKPSLADYLAQRFPAGAATPQALNGFRTRSQIKIQDGCNIQCNYCIVPQVRGEERSRNPEDIISEVKEREAEGYQEVVLTGTNIGNYAWQGLNLPGLAQELLARTGIPRLRLSSLQPQHLTPSFLSLWQDSRLCPHFHLPLQSGSDQVLKAMGRPYTVHDFHRGVNLIRKLVPQAAITTDVMVGFPGEGEGDFDSTLALCRELGLSRLHVFPYSPRPGTPAACWPQISPQTKDERRQRLLSLARSLVQDYSRPFLDQELSVLWEAEVAPGVWSGLSPNYLRVFTLSSQALANRITPVRLTRLAGEGMWGEVA